jgi:hypothetical protein
VTEVVYMGYVIRPKVHVVGEGHPAHGKWVSGEYTIGKNNGASYTENIFVHDAEFFEDEDAAVRTTLQLAKIRIDNDKVGY